MSDAIAVLNAGSSSLTFSLFAERGNALELTARGHIEGLYTAPRFVAKDRHGKTLGEKSWADGVELGHDRELGSLAAALSGLDAVVFTAGIGENSAILRERVLRDARWLGIELDPAANAGGGPRVSTGASGVSVWVIATNEELMIARHTQALLVSPGDQGP